MGDGGGALGSLRRDTQLCVHWKKESPRRDVNVLEIISVFIGSQDCPRQWVLRSKTKTHSFLKLIIWWELQV